MDKLKPCPKCAFGSVKMTFARCFPPDNYWDFWCPNCDLTWRYKVGERGNETEAEAIAAWNTRPLEDAARREGAERASEWWLSGFESDGVEKEIPDLKCELTALSYADLLEIHEAAIAAAQEAEK